MKEAVSFAKGVIRAEAEAIAKMADRLDESFATAVQAILACKGRVIVSGMGKSGLVGKKITATFNSTGISAFFLHPAEAMHGDLGLIRNDDILLLISKSGQQSEVETIISTARRLGIKIILLGGTIDSPLYNRADIALDCSVSSEACPNNLVPTSSSTAALVMGDALALAMLEAREFSPSDFANLHPGGSLGFRLLKHVRDLHHTGDELPLVTETTSLTDMIMVMTEKRLGCVLLKDTDGRPAGMFTDGDLRRLIKEKADLSSLTANEVMRSAPKTVNDGAILESALSAMEKFSITQLATVDDNGKLVGIIHLHDILRSKLV